MEAPQEVEVHVINHGTIEVKWRGVTTTIDEEPLEGYMVGTIEHHLNHSI